MAYIVNKYNGVALATVQDGTTDNSTDLTFIGKNYAGYGEVQNENFLHLLENFANTEDKQPTRPVEGQIWYDKSNRVLKFYDGYRFKPAAVEFGSAMPTNPAFGDLWWDSVFKKLYTFSGSGARNGFALIGPADDAGNVLINTMTVLDTSDATHDVVVLIANDVVVAIFNSDDAFDLQVDTHPIDFNDPDAFISIKRGITLRHTDILGESFKQNTAEWQLWGTASDSRMLGGALAGDYARLSGADFTGPVSFANNVTFGTSPNQLTIQNDSGNTLIAKTGTNSIKFKVDTFTNLIVSTTAVSPGVTGTIDLGASVTKWKDIYASGNVTADSVTGVLTGNIKDSTGSVILDNTAKTFKGNIHDSTGSVILDNTAKTFNGNITASDNTSAYNYTTKTFTGSLTGDASSASKLIGPLLNSGAGDSTNYPPATAPLPYTTVVRDSDGKINAGSITGNSGGADSLKITTTYNAGDWLTAYKPAVVATNGNTIVARNPNGDIFATIVNGVATSAYYADLAEKYVADADYETGTVVMVGGSDEVTACSVGGFAIGVVSENPAYMMNSGLKNGTYIALKGRVPTKVIGAVNKGDRLIASADGNAVANNSTANHCFGIALESSSDITVKLIEVLVL